MASPKENVPNADAEAELEQQKMHNEKAKEEEKEEQEDISIPKEAYLNKDKTDHADDSDDKKQNAEIHKNEREKDDKETIKSEKKNDAGDASIEGNSEHYIEGVINKVYDKKEEWFYLGMKEKIQIIDELLQNLEKCFFKFCDLSRYKRTITLSEQNSALEQVTHPDDEQSNKHNTKMISPRISREITKEFNKDLGKKKDSMKSNFGVNIQHMDRMDAACFTVACQLGPALIGSWLRTLRDFCHEQISKGDDYKKLFEIKEIKDCSSFDDLKLENDNNGDEQNINKYYRVKVGPDNFLNTSLLTFGSIDVVVKGGVETNKSTNSDGLVVILGAGNYDAPVDILTSLFIEKKVCIYKVSPYSQTLLGALLELFEPLVKKNYLCFVEGDNDVAKLLLNHEKVCKWYLTGSKETASNIIWGQPHSPPAASGNIPLLNKPCILELGNNTPYIIAPGKWTSTEIEMHAACVASGMVFNGGHICVHPQVLITCKNWKQREAFLNAIKSNLKKSIFVGCFYKGYEGRLDSIREKLIAEGKKEEDFIVDLSIPLSVNIPDTNYKSYFFVTDASEDDFLLKEEAFGPVSAEIALDTPDTIEEFLAEAVKFANTKVLGGLSCSVLCKAKTKTEKEALEQACNNLKYGSINVNADSKISFSFPYTLWGGYPNSDLYNLHSGIGFFGNCFHFKNPIKTIVEAPFLNLSLYLFALPTEKNVHRLEKSWKRVIEALCVSPLNRPIYHFFKLSSIVTAIFLNI